jgi:hypothetical protein
VGQRVRDEERKWPFVETGECGQFNDIDTAFAGFTLRNVGLPLTKTPRCLDLCEAGPLPRFAQPRDEALVVWRVN